MTLEKDLGLKRHPGPSQLEGNDHGGRIQGRDEGVGEEEREKEKQGRGTGDLPVPLTLPSLRFRNVRLPRLVKWYILGLPLP